MTLPPNRLEAAYAQHLPALRAIAARDAPSPRVDLTAASPALLGCIPRLEATLPQLEALPDIPWPAVAELPTRVMALVQAQGRHVAAERPESRIDGVLERARALRAELILAGLALGDLNGLSQPAVAKIRRGRGRGDIGLALIALSDLFRGAWPKIGNKTAVTLAQLDEAAALGDRVMTAIGEQEAARGRVAEATLMRNRAFVHFLAAERPARRGLVFLVGKEVGAEVLPNVFDWRRFGTRRKGTVVNVAGAEVPASLDGGIGPGGERAGADDGANPETMATTASTEAAT